MCFLINEGLCLASVIFDQETAMQATLASFYPILLLSGIIWPIEAQPDWLQKVSSFLPLTYGAESFRAILEKSNSSYFRKNFFTTFYNTEIYFVCFFTRLGFGQLLCLERLCCHVPVDHTVLHMLLSHVLTSIQIGNNIVLFIFYFSSSFTKILRHILIILIL